MPLATLANPHPGTRPQEETGLPLRRLSVDEYHALIDAGVLAEEAGVELLDGRLIEKRSQVRPDDPIIDGQHSATTTRSAMQGHSMKTRPVSLSKDS